MSATASTPATGHGQPSGPISGEQIASYLRAAGDGDHDTAISIVDSLLAAGVPAQRVLVDLIGGAQRQIGQWWAAGTWSVAREHTATAISEHVLDQLAQRRVVAAWRGTITVACVDGEWHSLPSRMLGLLLTWDGWHLDYLGPNVSGRRLIAHLQQHDSDALALSCMIATRLPKAHAAITASHNAGVPVITGGPGFGPGGCYARLFGADAWAADAEHAVTRLADAWPPPAHPRMAEVLGGDEYTAVTRHRAHLITAAMNALTPPDPAAPALPADAERIGEELGTVLDYLSAALYVDDPQLFTDFISWTTAVQQARQPAVTIDGLIDQLRTLLRDYPRALATLTHGRDGAANG